MKKLNNQLLIALMILFGSFSTFSQAIINCDTNIVAGQNLVINGGFEDGDKGFNVPGYRSWNKTSPLPGFSTPGNYYVSGNVKRFNTAFAGSPLSGSNFLMVDGNCDKGNIVWEQEVDIAKNTRYFFQVNIASIHSQATAQLQFEIAGVILNKNIIAPTTVGQWISFTDSSWFSAETEGKIKIRIRNDQTINCADGNDFALDDISFSPGCFFGAEGEIPYLGVDQTLCGTDGTITLKPALKGGSIYKYRWSNDETGESIVINKPGTYSVCMTTNGSCVKSDIIKITELYNINLDGDKAVCKEVKDTLIINHRGPLVSYKWYRNDELIPTATTDTLIPTQAGTYKVVVTDAAAKCGTKTDDMTLSVGTFKVNLGADRELCKPSAALLDAGYEGSSFQWFLNDVRLGQFNGKTATVNEVGQYKVVVSDPICPSVTAIVNVTSQTFSAVNKSFCPGDTDPITLKIKNTSGNATNYKWYSDAALTNLVATGLTYDVPAGLTQTTSFYVKDESVFQSSVGPKLSDNKSGGFGQGATNDKYISFNVTNKIIIDSVLVFPMYNKTFKVGFAVYNRADDQLVTSKIVDVTTKNQPDGNNLTAPTYVKLGIVLQPGQYYVKNTGTTGSLHYNQGQWTPNFPYNDPSGALSIIGLSPSEQWSNTLYGYFYDWHFSSGVTCDPVEVKAVYDKVACANCTSPSSVTLAQEGTLNCPTNTVTLKSTIVDGSGDWKYTWFKNGSTPVASTTKDITVSFLEAGSYTVLVSDKSAPDVCFATSASINVNADNVPTPVISINVDAGTVTCLISPTTISVTEITGFSVAPSDGDFVWKINGIIDISSTSSSLTRKLNNNDVISVTATKVGTCGGAEIATRTVTIKSETEITPNISLGTADGCANAPITINSSITPITLASGVKYTWYNGSTLLTNENGRSLTATFADSDSITVIAELTGAGCFTKTKDTTFTKVKIIDNVLPSVTITSDKNDICANQLPISFTVSDSKFGGVAQYQWFLNGNPIANATGTSYSTSAIAHIDMISVEMTSSLACVTSAKVNSNEIIVIIKPVVNVSVAFDKTDYSVCKGQNVAMAVSITPANTAGSYKWFKNGTEVGTDNKSFSTNDFANNDAYSVIFTPTIDCPSDAQVGTLVKATISTFSPKVDFSTIGSDTWCKGKENGFEVSDSTNGGTSPQFTWYLNGVLTSNTNKLVSSSFVIGDSIAVIMVPSAPNQVCLPDTSYQLVTSIDEPVEVKVAFTDSSKCSNVAFILASAKENEGSTPTINYYINDVLVTDTINGFKALKQDDELKIELISSTKCTVNSVAKDSVSIQVVQLPDLKINPKISNLSGFNAVTLTANTTTASTSILWDTKDLDVLDQITDKNATSISIKPDDFYTEIYATATLTEENKTCSIRDTAYINVNVDVKVPNAFSPNNDKINDRLIIEGSANFDEYHLTIFNKWGNIVFESTDVNETWDGTRNDKILPSAVYYLILEYSIKDKKSTYNDYILLIR